MGLSKEGYHPGRAINRTVELYGGNLIVPISLRDENPTHRVESWLAYKPLFCHNGTWRRQMNVDRIEFLPRTIRAVVDELAMDANLQDVPQIKWVDLERALSDIFSKDFSLNPDYFEESLETFTTMFADWQINQGHPRPDLDFFLPHLRTLLISIYKQFHNSGSIHES